jgi:hypothetical protein
MQPAGSAKSAPVQRDEDATSTPQIDQLPELPAQIDAPPRGIATPVTDP